MFKKNDKVLIFQCVDINCEIVHMGYKRQNIGKIGVITKDFANEVESYDKPCRYAIRLLDNNCMTGFLWSERELISINNKRIE